MAELELGELLQLKMEGGAGVVKNMVTGLLNGLEDMQRHSPARAAIRPFATHAVLVCDTTTASRPAPGVNPGLTISAALDSRFSVALRRAPSLLSVYLVRAFNTGPQSDTFRFPPPGRVQHEHAGHLLGAADRQHSARATFEFRACMRPQGALAAGDGRAVHDQRSPAPRRPR